MDRSLSLYQQVSQYFQPLGNVEALVLTTFGLDVHYLERSILPAFFPNLGDGPADEPHRPLFEYLEDEQIPVSVVYDANQLVRGETVISSQMSVTKELRWQAHPVVRASGCFHPKLILALVSDGEQQNLVLGCASANLTQPGWGRNFEACALETIALKRGIESSLLVDIGQWVESCQSYSRGSAALEMIKDAISNANPHGSGTRVHDGKYCARLWFGQGGLGLGEWLKRKIIPEDIRSGDWRLEILSPYISHEIPNMLSWVNKWIGTSQSDVPKILFYCPRDGELIDLDHAVLKAYESLENVGWAELVGESLKSRLKDEHGNTLNRFLHAKVYRFYTEETEILVIGSANATIQGHRDRLRGNEEACLVLRRKQVQGITLKPWLKYIERELTADDCKLTPSADEDSGSEHLMANIQAQFDWSTRVLTLANLGGTEVLVYLGSGSELCCIAGGGSWKEELDSQLVGSLFRSPAVRVANNDSGGQAWIYLVEELNLHEKPPAPSMERNVDDLIRDWQVGTDQRIAERVARESMPDDLRASSLHASPELDEGAVQDRVNDLFLAIYRFRREIEAKLSSDINDNRFARNQVQSRLFGRGGMSVRYFVEKVLASTLPDNSSEASMSPVEGYLAVLTINDALLEIAPAIPPTEFPEQMDGLLAVVGQSQARLRNSVFEVLAQENSADEAERLVCWVEENFRYTRATKEAS